MFDHIPNTKKTFENATRSGLLIKRLYEGDKYQ